ncbi:HK97 family phage prohead protease [Jannaschia sp. M317]|uniref:HK97 family phage prohead protease n=1 Tax=Jannaschia sp. M317 TaxID=2867011 RepID=UPI0021A36E65|nr:HK97 family phage prohead protease [Jannaschia sp. M317]UWQ16149.1 HK97 family phage prohead protease [Jannaschia sp. M317]
MKAVLKHAPAIWDVKELSENGEFEGYGSTFGGEPDSHGDIIAPGAYADSLASGKMPKMFWQHDSREPIGRWTEAAEDGKGLLLKGRLNTQVQRGREAYELLKAGDIDGLSIGYRIVEYTRNTDDDTWLLEKLDLIEVSVVSVPANDNATITNIKAARAALELKDRLAAGERLTEREFEQLLKGSLGLSNSQAERAARIHLKGPGDPVAADSELAQLWRAFVA